MIIFYKELSIEDGLTELAAIRDDRYIDGVKFKVPSGVALWKTCNETGAQMKCWSCGVIADRFILARHRNDGRVPPTLNLYARADDSLVMMTRDHIIPRSLGGNNDMENLRPACETCNNNRKNSVSDTDLLFMQNNRHLWRKTKLSEHI